MNGYVRILPMKPTLLSSEIIHENPWYRVRHDRLEWSKGAQGNYYVVQFNGTSGVICIRENEILLVEQYRYTIDRLSIEIPMGGIKPGQTPLEAAQNELQEETGYHSGVFAQIGELAILIGAAQNKLHVFVAQDVVPGESSREVSEEGMRTFWLPLTQWRQLIRENKIIDAETLAAWALYEAQRA